MARKTIFEKNQEGQHAYSLPKESSAFDSFQPNPKLARKTPLGLPEISELDLMRHFSQLARDNVGIDTTFYPLGSCTMKYNPRVNETVASMPSFTRCHPMADPKMVQGCLQVIYELIELLCQICGFSAGTLAPNAGAQGEFVGVRMISEYHRYNGDTKRTQMLVPDNAHGTNPATAAMVGFETVSIRSNAQGDLDVDHLREVVSDKTAGLMLTNPNTLGLFSTNIREVTKIVHDHGGLLFYDGANLNPILNIVRPGDMGFDVMHINLHKTFSTPHGGGGPGAGPVLCNDRLKPFLPVPKVTKTRDFYEVENDSKDSIGRISTFYGNFAICLRAYIYIRMHGHAGLRRVGEQAVLNANYLKKRLSKFFTVPYAQPCMHEFVIQATDYLDKGIKALDIAKRLLDYGVYAPTIYFPLIVKECMLIEPTETESKATLDNFVHIIESIVKEIHLEPETVRGAPHHTKIGRLDEVQAARKPILRTRLS
ncbi:MAG: aminomethyl-transferring glycine dehydrogenase subunit GcvPB [Chlamydiales bacterium]|nr:aminomethyl-transferring glycine dehydrogenase subunit GcvPB [Chlamydiales bacterium]